MKGFSLFELLATLLISGILLAVGAPALGKLILDARMSSSINSFIHSIHLAKQAAQNSVRYIALCKSDDGSQCHHDGDWHAGWIVFVNTDRDDPPKVDHGETILRVNGPYKGGDIKANRKSFIFRPFRKRSTNGTFIFCDRRGAEKARAVIVSYTGRPRVSSLNSHNKPLKCAP